MINKAKFAELYGKSLAGDNESVKLVVELLRPLKSDSVEELQQKIYFHHKVFYGASMKYKDAEYHREIDKTWAEQIHSFLNKGIPRYKGTIIIGFRESAKTTRVTMNEVYFSLYLPKFSDYTTITSFDGEKSSEITTDIYNALMLSRIPKYHGIQFPLVKNYKDKGQQTRSRIKTLNNVLYNATSITKTTRGGKTAMIEAHGEISTERPKKLWIDDPENEKSIASISITNTARDVLNSSLEGLDQLLGSFILTGNYLSLRGNVDYFLNKYADSSDIKIIMIPLEKDNLPTWPDKYAMTDAEAVKTGKVSIQRKRETSDNYETEYLNNPQRSGVYFPTEFVDKISEEKLVNEENRIDDGLGNGFLEIESPTEHDTYVIGIDYATKTGKDDTAFTILKVTNPIVEEVGNFIAKRMEVEDLTNLAIEYAKKYNNAFIIYERNYPGNEATPIFKRGYTNYYIDEKQQEGVQTNVRTKPEMFNALKLLGRDGLIKIRSKKMYNQILKYSEVDLLTRDEEGGHFDLLMSCVLAVYKMNYAVVVTTPYNTEELTKPTSYFDF